MKMKGVIGGICAAVLVLLLLCATGITKNVLKTSPDGVLASSPGMTFKEYASKQYDVEEEMTAFSVVEISVTANGRQLFLSGVLTDEKYAGVMNSAMASGNWFSMSLLERENNAVVIDSALATELFFSVDSVGREIEIDGRSFRICGVRESENGLIRDISTGGPFVYLPYTFAENEIVQHLFVANDAERGYLPEDVSLLLSDKMQLSIPADAIDSATDKIELVRVYPFTFLRIVIAAALILLAILIADALSRVFYQRRMRGKKTYLFLGVAFLVFVALVFLLCSMPRIPESFLPENSIFNLKHYLTWFVDGMKAANASGGSDINRYLLNATAALTEVYLLATVIVVAALLPLWSALREKVHGNG